MKEGFTPTFSQTKRTKKAPPYPSTPLPYFFFSRSNPNHNQAMEGKGSKGQPIYDKGDVVYLKNCFIFAAIQINY